MQWFERNMYPFVKDSFFSLCAVIQEHNELIDSLGDRR